LAALAHEVFGANTENSIESITPRHDASRTRPGEYLFFAIAVG